MQHPLNHNWYAIRVKPKREKTVHENLAAKGYESFLPLYLSRRKYGERFKNFHLPLFAGYLFCRFDPTDRLPILKTESVLYVLSDGSTPLPIPDNEIATLQSAVNSKLAIEPHPFIQIGDRIQIAEGPLRDTEGIFLRIKDREHIIVSVTMLQRSVSIQIDRNWIRPLRP
jgi:transcription antitermination factor NusG